MFNVNTQDDLGNLLEIQEDLVHDKDYSPVGDNFLKKHEFSFSEEFTCSNANLSGPTIADFQDALKARYFSRRRGETLAEDHYQQKLILLT